MPRFVRAIRGNERSEHSDGGYPLPDLQFCSPRRAAAHYNASLAYHENVFETSPPQSQAVIKGWIMRREIVSDWPRNGTFVRPLARSYLLDNRIVGQRRPRAFRLLTYHTVPDSR